MLVGVTLSANLDSSFSLAKAKRLVVAVNGCGSLAQEGGRSSLGCGHDAGVATSALPDQRSACSRTRTKAVHAVSNGQANDSFMESTLAMATLFLLRTVVLLGQNRCCYACMVHTCVIFSQ